MRSQPISRFFASPYAIASAFLLLPASSMLGQAVAEVEFPKTAAVLKESLKSVRYVHELKDGRVFLLDAGAQKLVVADFASGKVEERMSDGSDEKDFRAIGGIWGWPGDSVIALDAGTSRMLMFGPDGQFAHVLRFGPPPAAGAENAPMRGPRLPAIRALVGTESAVAAISPPRPPAPPSPTSAPVRVPYAVVRFSLRRPRLDTLAQLMPPQAPRNPAQPGAGVNLSGTFTVFVSTAPLQSVDNWAVLSDGTVGVIRAATYRIEWFAPDGTKSSSEPIPFAPIAVTSGDRKKVMEDYKVIGDAALAALPSRTSILAVAYDEPASWPTTHPPFRGDITPLVDSRDRMWLATRCAKDEQALCYDVIGRDGTRVTRYHLPPKLRVVGFGKDVVYTINEQKSDKDVLQRHPLN